VSLFRSYDEASSISVTADDIELTLISISEMPSGSPVVTVGVNKALNAGIYALKILGNESDKVRKMLKSHKDKQHKSVLKESQELKKMGLKKFVKKKFK